MKFRKTGFPGLWVIDLEPHTDTRGYFARTFCRREFVEQGLSSEFVQCNISRNPLKGTLRGMHYQRPPHAEVKLVRCSAGAVFDVVIDLRSDCPTFGQSFGIELNAAAGTMLYIPVGFAHGFLTLSAEAEVFYQMGDFHHPESAGGIGWDDPAFEIPWPAVPRIISERDRAYSRCDVSQFEGMFGHAE